MWGLAGFERGNTISSNPFRKGICLAYKRLQMLNTRPYYGLFIFENGESRTEATLIKLESAMGRRQEEEQGSFGTAKVG